MTLSRSFGLTVIALGEFDTDIISTHTAPYRLCKTLDELPAKLTSTELLITDMRWLGTQDTVCRNLLAKCAAGGAGWITLSEHDTPFKQQVAWLRTGVSHFLRKPLEPIQLSDLIDDIAERVTGAPIKVMLLDDSLSALYYYSFVLKQAGIEVQALQDPVLLLDNIAEFQPDVLIMDIEMPACRGTELVAILHQQVEFSQIPVIYLTAIQDVNDLSAARQSAAEEYLFKPVPAELLVTSIKLRARRYRAQQRADRVLRQREERKRARLLQLLNALDEHAIVSIANHKGDIIHVNERFCIISGYSEEELLGQNHRMLKSDLHTPAFFRDMWRTIAQGKVWHGEICNRRKNGELYWVEATIVPKLDDKGKPQEYIAIRTDVSQIKHVQEQLQISEERLRRGQAYANIGTWDWNIETGELYWSERIAALFGYPLGALETSYANFINAIHPDDRQNVLDAIDACIHRDAPYEIEHRVIWPDGTTHWLLERGAVKRAADGRAVQMLGVVQDISKRKQVEAALLDSENKLSATNQMLSLVLDTIPVRVFWKDTQSRYLGCNKAFANDAGCQTPADLVGRDDLSMPWAPEAEAFRSDDRLVMSQRMPKLNYEEAQTMLSGQRIWLNTSKIPLIDRHDRVFGILGVYEDISDRKAAETRLRESQQRFSFAVEGAGDGIWDWNMQTGEMQLSGHYEAMLGYQTGEVEPTIAAWAEAVHPDDSARVQQVLHDYLNGTQANYIVELRLRCKDGHYRWILCRGTVVARDENGRATRMIGIHTDITARKRVENELVQAREAAEQANRAKSDFLSNMSHELRTPMNAILGFAQLLEYEENLNDEQVDNVHEIIKAGHHLLKLINEVLDLAKIESGHIDLSLEAMALLDVAEECRQLVQPLLAARKLSFELSIPPSATIRADRVRLKQVLLNLLSNAIKYNREAGNIRVDVSPADDDHLRITVTDTGQGISPEHMKELFQPFQRLGAESGNIEGTGIGLSITQRLVELMGGNVGADSQVGVGSAFWIDLPVEIPVVIDNMENQSNGSSLGEQRLAQQRILCIDDNPTNLKLIAQILGSQRHIDLATAHTAELGIELARTRPPALILLDINMPHIDGYQVLEIFKANPRLSGIPVVAITANAMPRDIERGLAAGFADYLTKPLDIQQFLGTVTSLLSSRSNSIHRGTQDHV